MITQDSKKDGHGISVPGMIYAQLSTGEVVEHLRDDPAAFRVADTGIVIRRTPRA